MPRTTYQPAPAQTINTFTIGMYEIEHSGDIESVLDGLRKNGLVILSIVDQRDFTQWDSETGAVVITSTQTLDVVRAIVRATSFATSCAAGNDIEGLEGEAQGEYEHNHQDESDDEDGDY